MIGMDVRVHRIAKNHFKQVFLFCPLKLLSVRACRLLLAVRGSSDDRRLDQAKRLCVSSADPFDPLRCAQSVHVHRGRVSCRDRCCLCSCHGRLPVLPATDSLQGLRRLFRALVGGSAEGGRASSRTAGGARGADRRGGRDLRVPASVPAGA